VGRTEVELRTIALEERRMTATFFLRHNVHHGGELGLRLDRTGLGQSLTTLDVFTLGAAQQNTHVIASLALIEQLAEKFQAPAGGLDRTAHTYDFDFFATLVAASLDSTCHYRSATRDRAHVSNRHQVCAVYRTLRRGDVRVEC